MAKEKMSVCDKFNAADFILWYKDKNGIEPRDCVVAAAEYVYNTYIGSGAVHNG